jgi:hypothetical protein
MGQSSFSGLVLVKGDVMLSGGGSGVHLYGTVMVGKSAADPHPTVYINGNTKMAFSSLAVSKVSSLMPPSYSILSWREVR